MSSVTAMSVRIAHLSTAGTSRGTPGRRARISPQTRTGKIARPVARPVRAVDDGGFGAGVATAGTDQTNALDDHVPIDRFYTGLKQLHASPDVFIVDDFITPNQCDSIVAAAKTRAMDQSPVVYAGWTNDVSEVVNTAARGPALWIAALSMLAAASSNGAGPGVLINGAVAYALIVGVAAAGAGTYVKYKESQLRGMRTSTSCALDGASDGERAYVAAAEALLPGSFCEFFEAPTVIRYQPGQKLAPHFDANRGADVEDANRGGQTLATLLLYLNDVKTDGGATRFGRLNLSVAPKKGQCLVFFPATAGGDFDERVEHEGTEATEEKWICRIWRHERAVPPPFGLPNGYEP